MSFDDVARRMGDRHRQNMIPGAFENLETHDEGRAARAVTRIVIGSLLMVLGFIFVMIGMGMESHPIELGSLGTAGLGLRFIIRGLRQ